MPPTLRGAITERGQAEHTAAVSDQTAGPCLPLTPPTPLQHATGPSAEPGSLRVPLGHLALLAHLEVDVDPIPPHR
jgi:hypothetical protein